MQKVDEQRRILDASEAKPTSRWQQAAHRCQFGRGRTRGWSRGCQQPAAACSRYGTGRCQVCAGGAGCRGRHCQEVAASCSRDSCCLQQAKPLSAQLLSIQH